MICVLPCSVITEAINDGTRSATVTRVCMTEKGPSMVQATVSVSMLAQAVAESASMSRGAEST